MPFPSFHVFHGLPASEPDFPVFTRASEMPSLWLSGKTSGLGSSKGLCRAEIP